VKKHTLLATIGASPQVVTETLYAIHQANHRWPDDIYLITTSFVKEKAINGLINDGHLQRLCNELKRPMPAFDVTHVLVTPGADGKEVEDARSLADHEALANFIMTEVRNRTSDDETSLHASLAGGRKTMTFYIGYAMSLFGRVQDTLSHVLVSDGYENIPDFWFPTDSVAHRHVENTKKQKLDAAAAIVTLAPIPFIRHRRNLPQVLLQKSITVQFAELVELINLGENPDALRLMVNLPEKVIHLNDSSNRISLVFKPGLLELAFYSMMARATKSADPDLTRPNKGKPDKGLSRMLMDELLLVFGIQSKGSLENDANQLKDKDFRIPDDSLAALTNGINLSWFDSRKTNLRKQFERESPDSLLKWVLPTIIWSEDGSRLPKSHIEKTSKGSGYGLFLEADQIEIVETR